MQLGNMSCGWCPCPAIRLTLTHLENTQKIVVSQPVVELDGDEMTRIIWKKIREEVGLRACSPR